MGEKTHYAEGHCLCGQIRLKVNAPLRDILVCHCSQCQRWHGQAAYYTRAARTDIDLEGESHLRWFRSSESASRGFCGECGSNLFWAPSGEGFWSIAAGILYPGRNLSVSAHIFCDDATGYAPADTSVKCFNQTADGTMND